MRIRRISRLVAVAVLATALLASMATSAQAITRNDVLARARTWLVKPVSYSQSSFYAPSGGYRMDCSGYVSMCWSTGAPGYITGTLHDVSYPIAASQLKPGDALLWAGHHVRLFVAWADAAHTSYVTYEQTPPSTQTNTKSLAADLKSGYVPVRYNSIADDIAPWNLYQNSSFDVWSGDRPLGCSFTSKGSGTTCGVSTAAHTSLFAVRVANPNTTATSTADITQAIPVTAGNGYGLSVWARSSAVAGAVQIHLQFRDAAGNAISAPTVSGSSFGVNPSTFKQLSLSAVAPPGATFATVYLRLTGGVAANGTAGGAVVFDDAAMWCSSPMPVYRFYNKKLGSHFYTADGRERDSVADSLGATYRYEGVAYFVKTLAPANDDPLYRFYNKTNGSHFYTADGAEKKNVLANQSTTYRLDGPAYAVSVSAVAGAVPVYRFYNKRTHSHFYTISEAEKANTIAHLASTYSLDGVAFYLAQ